MKITKLATQERNVERVNMFLDGRFFCGVSLNTVAKFNLFVGKELSEDEFDKILQDDLKERIFNRAVTYISRAIKSEKQIRMYL
ncbi:MAG TPA: recombination regulator RecX, partial [Candidatus Dojkabacteria bacterium]|nr:recombination regulator RecX [Candidatus Dojkabacteria bacterium]